MPVVVTGIIDTEQMLLNVDTTAKKRVKSTLVKNAYKMRDLARKMAPVDEHNLEKAIHVQGDTGGQAARDELGRFARMEIEVALDLTMGVTGRGGKDVGDYAYLMHEHLTPYGAMKLGERSRAKQAGQPERVGGGFLERAAEAMDAAIDQDLLDIARDL